MISLSTIWCCCAALAEPHSAVLLMFHVPFCMHHQLSSFDPIESLLQDKRDVCKIWLNCLKLNWASCLQSGSRTCTAMVDMTGFSCWLRSQDQNVFLEPTWEMIFYSSKIASVEHSIVPTKTSSLLYAQVEICKEVFISRSLLLDRFMTLRLCHSMPRFPAIEVMAPHLFRDIEVLNNFDTRHEPL